MSAPVASLTQDQDDDGPEEGEIEDDEDDIILLRSGSPQRSSSPAYTDVDGDKEEEKKSYERDIRRFELYRARSARIRRASGGSKSPYGMASVIRSKDLYSRTKSRSHRPGLIEGKENRHVHRRKSPIVIYKHRSHDRTLTDFKDTSPLRRDSSCSSYDSDDRSMHHRSTYRRTSRFSKAKRKPSSSPDSTYIPSKRRSHHSEKCPLIKVLHSVAKETRLIAMETSESHPESSSLKQKLLNMGVMSTLQQEEKSSPKDGRAQVDGETSIKTVVQDNANKSETPRSCDKSCNESLQTGSLCEELVVVKKEPEIVFLTDSEDGCSNSISKHLEITRAPSPKEESVTSDIALSSSSAKSLVPSTDNHLSNADADDDEDDISHLRLLALQSKKHEQPSPDDADVLQLRLAALKTAFVKKFKIRKRIKPQASCINLEDPLSPLDEIPLPLSPPSPDEVMTPVDMELAETDDEANSIHSVADCYSPSDPTVSPLHDASLHELLPPPPPPDLPIDLYYPEQSFETNSLCIHPENAMQGMNMFHLPPSEPLAPPPLPAYFRDLLSGMPDASFFLPAPDSVQLHSEPIDNQCYITNELPMPQDNLGSIEENVCINDDGENLNVIMDQQLAASVASNLIEVTCTSENLPENDISQLLAPENSMLQKEDPSLPDNPNLETVNVSGNDSRSHSIGEKGLEALTKVAAAKSLQREHSLEEEEQMLRQRLLLNMANKRGILPANLSDAKRRTPLFIKAQEMSALIGSSKKTPSKPISNKTTESSPVKLKLISSPSTVDDGKLVVDLGDDSDSSVDYSEAEALGLKCAKNRENWLLHMKEYEMNIPKLSSPVNKNKANSTEKLSLRESNLKVKQAPKEQNTKKPFAENLADLESSVERFLKGVRRSHESLPKASTGASSITSSTRTPVAVRHLPVQQQEEYRRLKQQIAKLEKQRQVSLALRKQGPLSVFKGTQLNSAATSSNSKEVIQPSNLKQSKDLPTTPKSSKLPNIPITAPRVTKVVIQQSKQVPLTCAAASVQPTKVAVPKLTLNFGDSNQKTETLSHRSNKALANVSNLNVTGSVNKKNVSIRGQVPRNQQGLKTFESSLITERSRVLTELSALAKLLSQVDKSLEAQSHTATEVSDLIDKLCLAAGRWKAQNRTVAGLVASVAQRQKDLSLRHRRCVVISKSCAELGGHLHGKKYRVPSGKADTMRLQLKQVHEKTQDLAKRRTTEQSRNSLLEKRAENCLSKLFSGTKGVNNAKGNNTKPNNQAPVQPPSSIVQKKVTVNIQPLQPACSPRKQRKLIAGEIENLSSEASNPPTPSKGISKAVTCSTSVRSALVSRAIQYRMALNKIRSAKSVLNSSKRKNSVIQKKKRLVQKICSVTKFQDQHSRQDLSDMDISTDGEEVEKRNMRGNMEVVDMSVSPDASPLHVDIGRSQNLVENCIAPPTRNLKTGISLGISVLKPETSAPDKSLTKVSLANVLPPLTVEKITYPENGRTLSQCKAENSEVRSLPKVLKDYVSPLEGLNVFRNSSTETAKEGDLFAILCPYDLNGKCQDSECPFKHQLVDG